MADETRLLYNILLHLFNQAEVPKVLPQSERIKHGKSVVEQVPRWDVHIGHEQWRSVGRKSRVCVYVCTMYVHGYVHCVCVCACVGVRAYMYMCDFLSVSHRYQIIPILPIPLLEYVK